MSSRHQRVRRLSGVTAQRHYPLDVQKPWLREEQRNGMRSDHSPSLGTSLLRQTGMK